MTLTLHPYQQEAASFISREGGSGLLMDMGLGKTCSCLSALTPEMLPVLVTAPKRVAENVWDKEAVKWRPDLTVAVAKGTPAAREKALNSGADVVVISWDNLAQALPHAKKFRTFIVDELSGFKTRGTTRWRTARKIVRHKNCTRVWGLTGTPQPNGLLDLWAQMYLLDGGVALGPKITAYRERYFTPGRRMPSGIITEWDPRPEAMDRIHELLEDLCLAMSTEGRLDLPETTINDVVVPLPPEVRRMYKTMQTDLVLDLELLGGEVHSAGSAGVLSSKLAQITAGFIYVDDADLREGAYTIIHREKIRALQEIIDGTGSPVLVAYWFKAEREMLLEGLGSQAHTLDEPDAVDRWNAGELPVLLVHPASAGHGLNLQFGGHTLVWATLPWSLELYLQTNKRLARQGQEHPVVIHRLISPHTIDTAKVERLAEKKSAQQALLDHLESLI